MTGSHKSSCWAVAGRSGRMAGCFVLILALAVGAFAYKLIGLQSGSPQSLAKYAPAGTYAVTYVDFRRIFLDKDVRQLLVKNADDAPAALGKLTAGAFFALPDLGAHTVKQQRFAGVISFDGTQQADLKTLCESGGMPFKGTKVAVDDQTILVGSDSTALNDVQATYEGKAEGGLSSQLSNLAGRARGNAVTFAAALPTENRQELLASLSNSTPLSAVQVPQELANVQGIAIGIALNGTKIGITAIVRTSEEKTAREMADAINKSLSAVRDKAGDIPDESAPDKLKKDIATNTSAKASGADFILSTSFRKAPLVEMAEQFASMFQMGPAAKPEVTPPSPEEQVEQPGPQAIATTPLEHAACRGLRPTRLAEQVGKEHEHFRPLLGAETN